METLREKIWWLVYDVTNAEDADIITTCILSAIANHMEWTDPIQCRFGHVYSGSYEITQEANLYFMRTYVSSHESIDAAKTAAQAHKEGRL